jgi:hypothetical protein
MTRIENIPVWVNNKIIGKAHMASPDTIIIYLDVELQSNIIQIFKNGLAKGLTFGIEYMAVEDVNPAKVDAWRVTPEEFKHNSPLVKEHDRNARAYGYEVGKGAKLGRVVLATDDNPFMDPDWADKVTE